MSRGKRKNAIQGLTFLAQTCISDEDTEIFQMSISALQKIDKIEQIVERFKSQYDHTSSLDLMVEIKEILDKE